MNVADASKIIASGIGTGASPKSGMLRAMIRLLMLVGVGAVLIIYVVVLSVWLGAGKPVSAPINDLSVSGGTAVGAVLLRGALLACGALVAVGALFCAKTRADPGCQCLGTDTVR